MMVVCSVSSLVRTVLWLLALALVAGLALAGPTTGATAPDAGRTAPAATSVVQ
jgi:hypothetical protein